MKVKLYRRLFLAFLYLMAVLPVALAQEANVPLPTHADPCPVQLDPPDFTVKIRPELLGRHPRIFFDAAELQAIKQKIKDPRLAPMVGWFLHDADLTAAWPVPPTAEAAAVHDDFRHSGAYLQQLAFAYVITGDAKYLAAERNLINNILNWNSWDDFDLGAAHLCFGLSMAYDWLYDDFTPAERQAIEAALLKHGRLLLRDPATHKPHWWNTAYFQNHCWICHTAISVTAMALYDLHPEEMQTWLDDSRTSFQPTYKNLGLDGGYHEGAGYARYGTEWMLYYVDSLRHVSGENLFDMPFLQQAGAYFCNTIMPDWANLANFGDCPPTAWGYPIEDSTLVKLAAEYHDGHLIWLRDHNRPFYEKNPKKNLFESPLALIWVDPSIDPKPLDDLPLVGLYPDLGLVVARTSWKDDASVIALHCGAPGGQHLVEATPTIKNATANNGHTHPDANSFVFWANHGWLVGLPGAYTYIKATHNENTWLVSGHGQRGDNEIWFEQKSYMGKSDQAHLVTVATTPQADYAVGEAAPAYPEECGLTQFTRHLLFVKSATPYIVAFDQLAAHAPQTWASYLHTYSKITTVDENGFESTGIAPTSPMSPPSPAFGSLFSPGKLDLTAQPLMVLREHTTKPSAHGFELTAAPEGQSDSTWLITVVGVENQDVHLVQPGPAPEITVGSDHIAWSTDGGVSLNGNPIAGNLLPLQARQTAPATTLSTAPASSNLLVQQARRTAPQVETSLAAISSPEPPINPSLMDVSSSGTPSGSEAAPANSNSPPAQTELITNPSFESGLDTWQPQNLQGAAATFEVKDIENGKKAVCVTVPQAADKRYYVQLTHPVYSLLSANTSYTLSFRARSTPDSQIVVLFRTGGTPQVEMLRQDPVNLSKDWADYTYTFVPPQDIQAGYLVVSGLAASAGEYWFTDFSLQVTSVAASQMSQSTSPAPSVPPVPTPPPTAPAPTPAPPATVPTATTTTQAGNLQDQSELITNSNFENGLDTWQPQNLQGTAATFEVKAIENGKHALCVTVPQAGDKRYYVQLLHPVYSVLNAGKSYTLSFRARSTALGAEIVVFMRSGGTSPAELMRQDPLDLTGDWANYSYTFTPAQDCQTSYLTISGLAAAAGEYWFADVSLQEAPNTGNSPPPQAPRPPSPTEKTPVSIPGAEAFVYRDGTPDPMRLFVFKPTGWKASDHRPALIFFFGGGWTRGSPAAGADFARLAAPLGMVGIAPDYRTKTRFGTSPLASVADGRAALRWVQDHAAELGIDPARIIVGGHSAGGHVALWTAIDKTPPGSDPNEAPRAKPAALFLLAPVSDTSPNGGYTPWRFGADALALSPVHQLDGKMPPTLLIHADTDEVVPYRESVALNAALIKNGAVCEFVTVPHGKHGFPWQTPGWNTHVLMDRLMAFLKKNGILSDAATGN